MIAGVRQMTLGVCETFWKWFSVLEIFVSTQYPLYVENGLRSQKWEIEFEIRPLFFGSTQFQIEEFDQHSSAFDVIVNAPAERNVKLCNRIESVTSERWVTVEQCILASYTTSFRFIVLIFSRHTFYCWTSKCRRTKKQIKIMIR